MVTMLLVTIVLLNLLIALMGDSYQRPRGVLGPWPRPLHSFWGPPVCVSRSVLLPSAGEVNAFLVALVKSASLAACFKG